MSDFRFKKFSRPLELETFLLRALLYQCRLALNRYKKKHRISPKSQINAKSMIIYGLPKICWYDFSLISKDGNGKGMGIISKGSGGNGKGSGDWHHGDGLRYSYLHNKGNGRGTSPVFW